MTCQGRRKQAHIHGGSAWVRKVPCQVTGGLHWAGTAMADQANPLGPSCSLCHTSHYCPVTSACPQTCIVHLPRLCCTAAPEQRTAMLQRLSPSTIALLQRPSPSTITLLQRPSQSPACNNTSDQAPPSCCNFCSQASATPPALHLAVRLASLSFCRCRYTSAPAGGCGGPGTTCS